MTRPTILVVQDNDLAPEALVLLLGREVIVAVNGEAALNYLSARGKADFILMSQALLEEVRRCLG